MNSVPISPHPLRVPVDPRIRQRRIEVRRNEGRRRLRILVGIFAVALLTAAGWVASWSPLLDIDAVEVEGAVRTGPAVVREAGGLDRGQAMVDVDEGAAARRIESLPWVAEARVVRQWPGRVSITVSERLALAVTVDETGAWWLLDGTGRVLEQAPDRPNELVAVDGLGTVPSPGEVTAGAEAALAVSAALSPALRAKVDAVVVVEGGGVDLRLKGQAGAHPVVQLGNLDHLDQKLRAAESILASVDLTGLSTLDVRLPASPVLTRK